MKLRRALARAVASLALAGAADCSRPLFDRGRAPTENWSAAIRGERFKTIATIAGSDARTDMRMSLSVRQQLTDAGWTAVRRAGRWDSEFEAVGAICTARDGPVDGVLVVSYNRLKLYDCETTKTAYEIASDPTRGGLGLNEMTRQLMQYLRGAKQPQSP